MSILDSVTKLAGGFLGGQEGGGNAALLQQVMGMLSGGGGGQGGLGGLGGLIGLFQNKGLGDLVQSWVSTGENKAITPDQMQHAMGDQISGIASQLGLSQNDVAAQLSHLLPQLVDKLTPDGTVPDNNTLEQGLGALKGLLGK